MQSAYTEIGTFVDEKSFLKESGEKARLSFSGIRASPEGEKNHLVRKSRRPGKFDLLKERAKINVTISEIEEDPNEDSLEDEPPAEEGVSPATNMV